MLLVSFPSKKQFLGKKNKQNKKLEGMKKQFLVE